MHPNQLQLFLHANYFYNLGFNVSCINGKESFEETINQDFLKCPYHSWHHLIEKRQTVEELLSYKWDSATGLGVILGNNNIRCLDFDGVKDFNLITVCLKTLGLPFDYDWISLTGSCQGFHIFIRAEEHNIRSNDSRTKAFCSSGFYSEVFDRLELRWRNHVVIPPSKHRSLREYKFLHNEIPTQDILYIPIERIYNLAALVCSNNQGHDNSKLQFKRLLRNDYTFNVTDFCEIRKPSSEDSLDYVEFPDKEDFKQEGVLEIPLTASSEYLIDYIDSESVYINNGVFYIKPQPHSRYTKSEYSKSIDKDIWYLFIDVETTGLLNDDYFQTSRPARAVQIAWVAYDRNGKYLFERNYLIDVRSIEIPLKAIKIHHITSALASQFGTDLKKVLLELDVHLSFAEYIVGHNIDFDIEILKWEMDNALLPENYLKHPKPICTMKSTSGLFQNPEYGDDNYLSLEALYKALFGTEFFGVHNALCDAKATAECFWELKEHWVNI